MEFSKAQQEFQIRYYLWSVSEFEKEIEQSFPNLRLFKAGYAWQKYQFMQLLGKKDQLTLAHGFLKRWHRDAIKLLGEKVTSEEETLVSRCGEFFRIKEQYQIANQLVKSGQTDMARFAFEQCVRPYAAKILGEIDFDDEEKLREKFDAIFCQTPTSFEENLAARKINGERVKFVSKRKLQKVVMEKFKETFSGQIIDSSYDDISDPSSSFDLKCCGWILSTHFWFGRRESLIEYSQTITSPTRIKHPDNPIITGPAMLMGNCISWLCMNQWEYISAEEMEATCDRVIKSCKCFIEVAPKLLKGLEFETITAN
jgi:hypothetical protein